MAVELEVLQVKPMDMLSMAVIVLFVGVYLNERIHFLKDNYIPPAVTGGLLFAIGTMALFNFADVQVEFDMRMRDLLLLVFFSTVGLSARISTLAAGGKALFVLALTAGVFLFLQNAVGVGLAMAFGAHPAYGLMAGSVAFAGGHGTAIAWGEAAERAGLEGASGLGLAFATFGLVSGGLVGGPIAKRLMDRNGITGPGLGVDEPEADADLQGPQDDWLLTVLGALLILALCVSVGDLVNRALADGGLRLPGFLTSMFVGIVITNIFDWFGRPLHGGTIDKFGTVALHVFLAMSMMAIQLWTLGSAARAMAVVLFFQVLLMTGFAIYVVYRIMGRDYDAVVMSTGFAGLGLGATPVAIANMNAVTGRYGPSTKAFLVVPLVGALFIDLLNAGTINFFISLMKRFLL